MERHSLDGINIEFEEDSMGHLKVVPNPDEQLPLDVCSNEQGCFIYDLNGAEIGCWYRQDWEDDPKLIVWMVEQMRDAYERPMEPLNDATRQEAMTLFYDAEYPTDDVPCKQTNEATFGEGRELPSLDGRDAIDPEETPLTVELDDHYADDTPSVVRIRDEGTILKEWVIEHTEDESKNAKLGAEVAWNIRLAYERPWELRA